MSIIRIHCYLLVLLFLLPYVASAQEEPPVFNVSFQTLFLNRTSERFTFITDGKIQAFPVNYDIVSEAVSYRGPSPMLVFRGEPDLEAGNLPAQAIASIPVASMQSDFTLICATDTGKLSWMPIGSDLETIPAGSFCFINATSNSVIGLLDEERIGIRPREFKVVPGEHIETRRIPIRMAYQKGDDWEVFYSSKWTALGNKRAFIIVYNSPNNGRLNVRGVDFR